jgi:hypothetical protein
MMYRAISWEGAGSQYPLIALKEIDKVSTVH